MFAELINERLGGRAGRAWRTARRLLLLAACLWLAWEAYRRMTVRAVAEPITEADVAPYRVETGRPDVTDELRAALGYFKSPPVAAEDALQGPWTPANRPELRLIIQYLDSPATQAALEQISRLSAGSLRIPVDELAARDPVKVWYGPVQQASGALRASRPDADHLCLVVKRTVGRRRLDVRRGFASHVPRPTF